MDKELNEGFEALKKIISGLEKEVNNFERRVARHKMIISAPQVESEKEKVEEMLKLDSKLLELSKNELKVKRWLLG